MSTAFGPLAAGSPPLVKAKETVSAALHDGFPYDFD